MHIGIVNRFHEMISPAYPLGDALQELGAEVTRLDIRDLWLNQEQQIVHQDKLFQSDVLLWRITDDFWQSAFHFLRAAEKNGALAINNPESIQLCIDKWSTYARLQDYNIPVAPTSFIPHNGLLQQSAIAEVSKPLDGCCGHQVRRLEVGSQERLKDSPSLAQPYLGDDINFARILLVNGKFIGSYKRLAAKGKLANNFDSGGKIIFWKPTDKALEIAIKASRACGVVFGAVDLVNYQGRWQVVEINAASPGYGGLALISGGEAHKTIAKQLIDYIVKNI